jgi:two-component system, sensor histidine kinase and response regulator
MRPTVVDSGRTALAALENARARGTTFPLVLLDAHMPDLDGFAVAERIKADPALSHATIMLLTSDRRRGDSARCQALGIKAFLTKPITPSELLEAITAALGATIDRVSALSGHSGVLTERPVHVLVVEDNPVNQQLIVRLLEKRGYTVGIASTGIEALAALDRRSFELVLMDVQMPEMDGIEATVQIRERERATGAHLPVVALTAHAMAGDRKACLAAGMDGYVTKPIRAAELFAAIDQVLGGVAGLSSRSESPSGTAAPVPIDVPAALARVEGDDGLLKELAVAFLQDCPGRLDLLRTAIEAGDHEQTERAAHSLKGVLGIFGATAAEALTLELERLGRQRQLETAPRTLARLNQELARVTASLSDLVGDPGLSPSAVDRPQRATRQ